MTKREAACVHNMAHGPLMPVRSKYERDERGKDIGIVFASFYSM